ncbi:FAD-dependent monooxygenase [Streptomyces sp. Da 82-17]|uniref:FAD-dependent monooxygenase n=1 Tax=Streptomyces sp. Da 82-17 TaxID=3377116 RepID=UPI0038D3FBEA
MSEQHTEDVQVLVVGGAIVGLSAALFLARKGIRTLVVERQPSTLRHPRARVLNPRTVEIYRQAGLEEALFSELNLSSEMSTKLMVRAETLAGPEFFSTPLQDEAPELTADVTPCTWCSIDQDKAEGIITERAAELGARIDWATELVALDQHADGVSAVLHGPDGAERTVRADYVIGADGTRSTVRRLLGIPAEGPGTLVNTVSVVFRADLSEPLRGRDIGLGYLDKPESGTLLIPLDDDRWVFYTPYHPEQGDRIEDWDEARCVAAIRAAAGVPELRVEELEVQIEKTGQKILGFEIAAQLAARYRDGRVFLAGDAAHATPPTGAFGASTGIQDAHNLAWKLAAVLDRTAGEALLDSYEAERRPVAEVTTGYAMAEMQGRSAEGQDEGALSYASVVLGHRYTSGAVLAEPGDESAPPAVDPRRLGRPGTRAPHLAGRLDGKELSALDLVDAAPVLLAGPAGAAWEHAAGPTAQRLGIDLEVHRVGGDFAPAAEDATAAWTERYGVGADGAVLVRPDGVVAWRATGAADHAQQELERVLGQVLDRA